MKAAIVSWLVVGLYVMHAAADLPIKFGLVYINYPTDGGWTYQHDVGRQVVENYWGKSTVLTNYSGGWEIEDQSTPAFLAYAQAGYDLVVATSFGLGAPAAPIAENYTNVHFAHIFGPTFGSSKGNWANVRPLIYQAIHVAGYVAGAVSAGPHCFLAPMRFSEVYQAIDSYALGVQRARGADAKVEVTFIGSWYDTELETAASRMLLERGCEVISLYTDTPLPLRIFSAAGKFGVGAKSDMSLVMGETDTYRDPNVLVSAIYKWDVVYDTLVRAILNNSWIPEWELTGGMSDGLVAISSLSPHIPMAASTQAEALAKQIRDKLTDAFVGPLYDVAGSLRVGSGVTLTPEQVLADVTWLVKGVVDLGDFDLVTCNAGTFISNGTCVACPIGSYSGSAGLFSCSPCPAGNTSTSSGASYCSACEAGTFKANVGPGECVACNAGSAAEKEGATECTICPAGAIASTSGLTACTPCELGTYSNITGGTGCTRCPDHATTAVIGATSQHFCRCVSGYQQDPDSTDSLVCISGKSGTEIISIGLGVAGAIIAANLIGLAGIIVFIFHKTEA